MKKNIRLFSLLTLVLMVFGITGQVYAEASIVNQSREGSITIDSSSDAKAGVHFSAEDFIFYYKSSNEEDGLGERIAASGSVENGKLVFKNLKQGSYTIEQAHRPEPIEVTIPMTNSDGTEWKYDIEVTLKDLVAPGVDDLYVEKYIVGEDGRHRKDGDYEYKGSIEWIVESTIPASIVNKNSSFTIDNSMDNRLDYVDGSAKLLINGVETDVRFDNGKIIFTEEDYSRMREAYENDATSKFYIKYTTRVDRTNSEDLYREIESGVRVSYINGKTGVELKDELVRSNRDIGGDSDAKFMPMARTFGLNVIIADEKNSENLAGSQFKILDKNGNTLELFEYDEKGNIVENESKSVFTSKNVQVRIFGLKTDEYKIVQTKAINVNGRQYNLLREPKVINIGHPDTELEVVLYNNTGFQLPVTGGMGTTVLTLGGVSLLMLAVVLKRRNAI